MSLYALLFGPSKGADTLVAERLVEEDGDLCIVGSPKSGIGSSESTLSSANTSEKVDFPVVKTDGLAVALVRENMLARKSSEVAEKEKDKPQPPTKIEISATIRPPSPLEMFFAKVIRPFTSPEDPS
jgi:hypothetical protein